MNEAIKITSIVTKDEGGITLQLSDILLITRPDLSFTTTLGELRDLISDNGTHATRYSLEVDNTDNTSDALKPISNATQGALNGKAAVSHTHPTAVHDHAINQVNNLQDALDGKSDDDHGHEISDVNALQGALNGKAPLNHSHATGAHNHDISEVNDLQDALDDKAEVNHAHIISNVQNLQSELNGRALVNHTHPASRGDRDVTADVIIGTGPVAYYPCNDETADIIRPIVGHHLYSRLQAPDAGGRVADTETVAPFGTWSSMYQAPSSPASVLEMLTMPALSEFTMLMALKPNATTVSTLQVLVDFTGHLLIMEGGTIGLIEKATGTKEMMGYIMMVPSFCLIGMFVDTIGNVTLKMGPNKTALNINMNGQKYADKFFTSYKGHVQHIAIYNHVLSDALYTTIYRSFRRMKDEPEFVHLKDVADMSYADRDKPLVVNSTGTGVTYGTTGSGGSSTHSHAISDVTGLQHDLDFKADVSHTHTVSNVANLETWLDEKSDLTHVHTDWYATDPLKTLVSTHRPLQYFPLNDVNWTHLHAHVGTRKGYIELPGETTTYLQGSSQYNATSLSADGEFGALYIDGATLANPLEHTSPVALGDFSVMIGIEPLASMPTTLMKILTFSNFTLTVQGDKIGILRNSNSVNTFVTSNSTYAIDAVSYIGLTRNVTTGVITVFLDGVEIVTTPDHYYGQESFLKLGEDYSGSVQHLSIYDKVLDFPTYMEQWKIFKGMSLNVVAPEVMSSFHHGVIPDSATIPFHGDFATKDLRTVTNSNSYRAFADIAPTAFTKVIVKVVRPVISDCGVSEFCGTDSSYQSEAAKDCNGFTDEILMTIRWNANDFRGSVCVNQLADIKMGDMIKYYCTTANGLGGLTISMPFYVK